ncbi:hypothetical protein GGI01_003766 [Coemansia sp. RSA 376]|nr:hypothetical protein GGI01_003766 [Coemansia sp. RSA 376]
MRVDSLLNPAPAKALESGSDTEYAATTFEESNRLAHFIGNERDDFEMALWRQESGLGPPQAASGETRFFGQNEYVSGDRGGQMAGGRHGGSASAHIHAKYMRQAAHSGDTQASPFYASALAYARSEKQTAYHSIRQSVPQNMADDVRPQIFVERPPIVAHGAMSIDKSGDYIRPTLSSDHMLGQVVLSDSSAISPRSAYASCRNNSPGSSSSPPSLSSSTAFSDAGSSSSSLSVRSQTFGKRLRLHPTDAAAAAAVLTSLSGRMAVDEFDDDEDDDEIDPYADVFAAASRAAMPKTFSGYAGFGLAGGANSAPCSSVPAGLTCYPPPPLPRLTNSSPSIVTTNLDDEKRSVSHKRKSSRASAAITSAVGNLNVTASTAMSGTKDETQVVRRHRAKASVAKSAKDGNSSSSDCTTTAEEKPVVNWKSLEVPEDIWTKTQELYDEVKGMKKVQNRQPVRKRPAILAALMFILCRSHGYPRTFAEICTAANVTKRDIGMYYKLMHQVLDSEYTSIERAKPSAYQRRWCSALDLPSWMAEAASCIYDRADSMAIVQGKCPVSVSAASIWLVVWAFNYRHALDKTGFALPEDTPVTSAATPNLPCFAKSDTYVSCNQHDVCKTTNVVIATLTSVFKLLLPHLKALVEGLLIEHL